MKLILSRKGYDAENGGGPSPILPDGTMVSLPIPSRDGRRYRELLGEHGPAICETLRDLDLFSSGLDARCHLDPDLAAWTVPREPSWRPSFGQLNAAAGHLDNQGVDVGDLFVFFGWFRRTAMVDGKLCFVKGAHQNLHVIFGWLEIGEIIHPGRGTSVPAWLADHPHCSERHRSNPTNRIYIARDCRDRPTAGVFRYDDRLVLTKPGMTRTRWALDRETFGGVPISYHSTDSWKGDFFQSASKGQEFVLSMNARIDAWVRSILATSSAFSTG